MHTFIIKIVYIFLKILDFLLYKEFWQNKMTFCIESDFRSHFSKKNIGQSTAFLAFSPKKSLIMSRKKHYKTIGGKDAQINPLIRKLSQAKSKLLNICICRLDF